MIHSNNLKRRFVTAIILCAIVVPSLLIWQGNVFRILYAIACAFAVVELCSFVHARLVWWTDRVIMFWAELFCVILSAFCIFSMPLQDIVIILLAVVLNDGAAYFIGCNLGGTLHLGKPFPFASPNKSWEGLIGGMAVSTVGILLLDSCFDVRFNSLIFLCPPCAVLGDAFESYVKRLFIVKDSCDCISGKFYTTICNFLLGGKEGHGGFLDRIDSFAFTATVIFYLNLLSHP